MHGGTSWVALTLVASLALASTAPAQAALLRNAIGTVEKVQASAEALYDDRARDLSSNEDLYFEDRLKTGAAARLAARLADGAELTLGENAELLIDEFVYRPWSDSNKLSLAVSGAFLFVGGRIENGSNSEVQIATPVATLGIRGTTVWGGFIDHGYGVLVLKGEVDVETPGGKVTLRAGQGTMIASPTSAPEAPGPWSQDRTQRAVGTISFGR